MRCELVYWLYQWMLCRKLLEIEPWFRRTINRKWPTRNQMVTWSMMSRYPKRSSRDQNTLRVQYRENSWRCYLATITDSLHWGSTVGYPGDSLTFCFYCTFSYYTLVYKHVMLIYYKKLNCLRKFSLWCEAIFAEWVTNCHVLKHQFKLLIFFSLIFLLVPCRLYSDITIGNRVMPRISAIDAVAKVCPSRSSPSGVVSKRLNYRRNCFTTW